MSYRPYDVLQRLTYKPGWEFRVFPGPSFGGRAALQLEVKCTTPDVQTGRPVSIVKVETLGPGVNTDADFIRIVHDAVRDLEGHERLEWFQVDGEPVWEPHPVSPLVYLDAAYGPTGHPRV